MRKTIISKRDLDALIRMHIVPAECAEVTPLPVVWRARSSDEPNWAIPGWMGDSKAVGRCVDHFRAYLRQLRSTYDIPDEQ
jgi:hypothetical protein